MESDPKTTPPDDEPRDPADSADAAEPPSPAPPLSYADPATPSRAQPTLLPYANRASLKLKTIRQLASFEANLAAAKLEAAGVTCFVIDDNIATAYPLIFASVKLQVPEDEVEQAEAVLARPHVEPDAAIDDDESDADSAGRADAESDYVDEAYRCPKCHRKDVELLPLSGVMRNVRVGCLLVLVTPIVASLAAWVMHSGSSGRSPDLFSPEAMLVWVAVVGILSVIVLTAKRRKRCRACGHAWAS